MDEVKWLQEQIRRLTDMQRQLEQIIAILEALLLLQEGGQADMFRPEPRDTIQ